MTIRSGRALVLSLALLAAAVAPASAGARTSPADAVGHVVVIYQENHSFDNLYGGWEGGRGLAGASSAKTTQVNQAGQPYSCLLQNAPQLTVPPLEATCSDATTGTVFTSH